MKKILIIGPIGDFGGRELEAGFIADSLKNNAEILICSTGVISNDSQVFNFVNRKQVVSLKALVFDRNFLIKLFTYFSWLKNNVKGSPLLYLSNKVNKKYFNLNKLVKRELEQMVQNSDVVIICAQLTSNYVKTIIISANKLKIPVFFRTTGTIKSINLSQSNYLELVTQFIHHSKKNAFNLNSQMNLPYKVIDQCAFNEKELLKIPLISKKVKKYLVLGRIEKEKNIDIIIRAFLKVKEKGDLLYIIGAGSELLNLKELSRNNDFIIFTGFVNYQSLKTYFHIADAVVIASKEETGPLVGIEAMAGGKIIISTKVGAMPDRLIETNAFWFEQDVDSLTRQLKRVKNLTSLEVLQISKTNRGRYLENYSLSILKSNYLDVLNNVL
ncbi:glycosyltransferase family 4 protein [Tamlana haliotis]|uniref:Glycosyltransferase family 4 protein n=1 Tax=Pseudotamlana haliotis TaxID=2614804 RepID=A0A6N6MCJ2_9FLAO|nr:glycosyltransferase family 4 protein [Tamlana haliotis]KAB1067025.1 glycosyltransferase family 4 protein [Tamlana haliotis]